MSEIFPGYGMRPPAPPTRRMRKPVQQSIAFESPAKVQAARVTYYSVGGNWQDWSGYIDPRTVPLCSHDHGPVDRELMQRLVQRCLWEPFFRRRCLLAEWRGHPAGTTCFSYGETSADSLKYGLWVELTS